MNIDAKFRKKHALSDSEEAGDVADSLDVRVKLLGRVESGEISLEEAQVQLAKIKNGAKSKGLKTRSEIWRES